AGHALRVRLEVPRDDGCPPADGHCRRPVPGGRGSESIMTAEYGQRGADPAEFPPVPAAGPAEQGLPAGRPGSRARTPAEGTAMSSYRVSRADGGPQSGLRGLRHMPMILM